MGYRFTLLSLLGALAALWVLTECVSAGALSEDSARFAVYWDLMERGDSTEAQNYLLGLGEGADDHTGRTAGFMLAWQAYLRADYTGVPAFLDLGVPAELTDHALWLRADALGRAGQKTLSAPHWSALAADTASVYASEALYRVACLALDSGDAAAFFEAEARHELQPSSAENRQHLALLAAQAVAQWERHTEAVDRLWRACTWAPLSAEGRRIREMLRSYEQTYGFPPRAQTGEELRLEFKALEAGGEFSSGLQRVREEMQSAQGAPNADLLGYYKGRFETGVGRYRDAIRTLTDHTRRFPGSPDCFRSLFWLGRSAYLRDQDSLAISVLGRAAGQDRDTDARDKALELLGTLHLDRGRPQEAVPVYRRWEECARGTASESDGLWRLGWALWEAKQEEEAAHVWQRLVGCARHADNIAAALYWSGRALNHCGRVAEAAESLRELRSRFPYSYYAILSGGDTSGVALHELPLRVPGLDEVCVGGGAHSAKFAVLAAMRLADLALREWDAAAREQPDSVGFAWWKAQLHEWRGDHMAANRVLRTSLAFYLRAAGERPPGFYALAYPLDFDPQIVQLAREHGLDPYFVFALICQESHFDPEAVSPVGAVGLMQLMPATARAEARKLGISYHAALLRQPEYNLRLGTAHLTGLIEDFNGDTLLVLAAYNAGASPAQAWYEEFGHRSRDEFIELIPYRETRLFVKRNIEHKAAYRRLYPDAGVPPSATLQPRSHSE